MHGYGAASYGDGMAEVYDDWYGARADTGATLATLADLAADGPVLELGAGTGRLAVPLAARGLAVHALDASDAMLAALRAKPGGAAVVTHLADMAAPLPGGPYRLVFVAVNTLFNVTEEADQRRVFAEVARVLAPGGRFVVEAFVPEQGGDGDHVTIREMGVGRVVLSVSRADGARQRAEGQFVELVDGEPVRLRPWAIRWATPAQLDAMAVAAGLELEERWSDWARTPPGPDDDNHVSVYRVVG